MKYVIMILMMVVMAVGVTADLEGAPALSMSLINQDPDPATVGDTLEIRIGLENTGGEAARDIIVEFIPEFPFELPSGQSATREIGSIGGHQDGDNILIVKYDILVNPDAKSGEYDLKIRYTQNGEEAFSQKIFPIELEGHESAEVIHIDQDSVSPGKKDTLSFTINNVGSAPLRDITFSWLNEDEVILPVGSDNTKHINLIDIGKSAEIEYSVIADSNADPGLYKLDLSLTYYDSSDGSEKSLSSVAGLYVGGETDFDVSLSETSDGETSLTIANIGSNPANSVSIAIPQQQGWSVQGASSQIIGNLNAGDYTVASFALQGRSDKIDVEVHYTDTMGYRQTVDKTVEIGSSMSFNATGMPGSRRAGMAAQQETTNYALYIGIALVLLVGVIIYSRRHKKK